MTHYEVLGVTPSAAPAEVRHAYVDLARRHHPDRADSTAADTDRMREINVAWSVLGDPERRLAYDRGLAEGRRSSPRLGDPPDAGPTGTSASFVGPHLRRTNPENATTPGWVPIDDHLDDEVSDQIELLDDTPVPGTEVPQWMQVVPPYLLGLAVISVVVGLVASLDEVLALGVVAFVLSVVLFAAVPVFAIFASRSHDLDP